MKLRDWLYYSLGVFTGATALYVYIVYLDWARFKEQTDKLHRDNRKRPPVQLFKPRDGRFKFLGIHGEKDPQGKRIFPPPHAGGRPTDEIDGEIFTLMQEQKLKPEQAWQELIRRYPETLVSPTTGEPYDAEMIALLKTQFKQRMRNRKRK